MLLSLLILFLIFSVLLLKASKIPLPPKLLIFVCGVFFIGLCALEIISFRLTGFGFNQAVVYHLEYGLDGAGIKEFRGLIIAGTSSLIASIVIWGWLVFSGRKWSMNFRMPSFARFGLASTFAVLAIVLHPTLSSIIDVMNPAESNESPIIDFYQPPEITGYPKKLPNIIWIYGESLERTYFNESAFPDLMPNLKKLERESLSFTDIAQIGSVGFTIGGIVASQCGVPLISAGSHTNSMGAMPVFLPGAVCIGDLLSRNSYQLEFFGGADPMFAGKGKFLKGHGFREIYGKDKLIPKLPDKNYVSDWGIYDDSLFGFASNRHKELVASQKPYGLFVLTLDTHHPSGHIPKACEGMTWGDGKNALLNAVHCSDKLISDFVRETSARDPEALIVIASDHLAMWNDAYDILQPLERRDLLMYHWPKRIAPASDGRKGETYSSGVTALNLMGFKTKSIGLGRDLLAEKPMMREILPDPEKTVAGWHHEFKKLWHLPTNPTDLEIDPSRKLITFSGFQFPFPIIIDIDPREKNPNILFGDVHMNLADAFPNLSTETRSLWLDSCEKVRVVANHESQGDPNKFCLWDDKVRQVIQIDHKTEYKISKI